jgi:hypothetical protein
MCDNQKKEMNKPRIPNMTTLAGYRDNLQLNRIDRIRRYLKRYPACREKLGFVCFKP